MRILYLDCFAGISGDMLLGALCDAGADFTYLQQGIAALSLHPPVQISRIKVSQRGFAATKVRVEVVQAGHEHRHLHDIKELIAASSLSAYVKNTAISVFEKLAQAEASVHGISAEEVHFHEVGALDAIVDVVGTILCLENLGIDKVTASPFPTFQGTVTCAHGKIPLPAPGTLALLQGVPWRVCGLEAELVTPTGAALAVSLAESFGAMPPMKLEQIGCGAGERSLPIPNILRALIGVSEPSPKNDPDVLEIETNIDDMNPQHFEHLFEELFRAGALDAFVQNIFMKKGRPGFLLKVLCEEKEFEALTDVIFHNTSTIGIRHERKQRRCLDRTSESVITPYGDLRVKVATRNGEVFNAQPEYSDCLAAAKEHNLPLKTVYNEAIAAYQNRSNSKTS